MQHWMLYWSSVWVQSFPTAYTCSNTLRTPSPSPSLLRPHIDRESTVLLRQLTDPRHSSFPLSQRKHTTTVLFPAGWSTTNLIDPRRPPIHPFLLPVMPSHKISPSAGGDHDRPRHAVGDGDAGVPEPLPAQHTEVRATAPLLNVDVSVNRSKLDWLWDVM